MNRRVWLFALVTTHVGCTLLTPLDVFDAPARSDATDANDDAIGDALGDALGTDVDITDAAANDAGPDAALGCSIADPNRIFCDDFDDLDAALDQIWPTLAKSNGGTVDFTTDTAFSAPRSLKVTSPDAPGIFVNAAAARDIAPGLNKDFSVRFRLRPKKINSTGNGYATIFSIGFDDSACVTRDSGSHERRITLTLRSTTFQATVIGFGATCVDAGADDLRSTQLPPLVDSDAWTEYELRFASASCNDGGSTSSLRVKRDGVVQSCISLPTDPTTLTNTIELRAGLGIGAAWTASEAEYDDVGVFIDE